MDDLLQKIQNMLSDEESMKQIKEIASMFSNTPDASDNNNSSNSGGEGSESTPQSSDIPDNSNSESANSSGGDSGMPDLSSIFSLLGGMDLGGGGNSNKSSNNSDNGGGFNIDIDTIIKITSLLSSLSTTDKNSELLQALKPHLTENRRPKVDKAIKLLKLYTLWTAAKDSGLLSSIDLF